MIKMISSYCIVLIIILALVKFGDRAVTVIVEHSSIEGRTCIAIDAGHGGIDGGAVSISGIPESRINLEICERLNDLFHLLGYDHLDEGEQKAQMRAREEAIAATIPRMSR